MISTRRGGNLSGKVLRIFEANNGIFRLAPTWVPRAFLVPGRRIKLASEDIYGLGVHRGGISERWFASTTRADNGPGTPDDEGLSYIVGEKEKITLKDAIESEGKLILGEDCVREYKGWKVYAKFFDNMEPIPLHLHIEDKFAKKIGQESKPEAYYFPSQLNYLGNNFPFTFLGLEPGTTREDIHQCLEKWDMGDNGILDFSKAYRLKPGTGWLLPPGILHAPGTFVTFEVQWASDVYSMYQSMVAGRPVPKELLLKDVPPDKQQDCDYLLDMINWELNLDPEFKKHHYLEPIPVTDTTDEGFEDKWVIYGKIDGKDMFSAKELTVLPGKSVSIKDKGAYGLIVVQGYGKIGGLQVESATVIRYGDLTRDELFVSAPAAEKGVNFQNTGCEPLVILRYFGPGSQNQSFKR